MKGSGTRSEKSKKVLYQRGEKRRDERRVAESESDPLFPLPKQQVEGGSLLCTGRGPKHLEKRAGGGREDRLCAPSLGGGEGEGKRGGRG